MTLVAAGCCRSDSVAAVLISFSLFFLPLSWLSPSFSLFLSWLLSNVTFSVFGWRRLICDGIRCDFFKPNRFPCSCSLTCVHPGFDCFDSSSTCTAYGYCTKSSLFPINQVRLAITLNIPKVSLNLFSFPPFFLQNISLLVHFLIQSD